MSRSEIPVALTIAGSDSGGGAGIQADLKTFASLGVHGTCAVTCITAQNPKGVTAIQGVSPKLVTEQLKQVVGAFEPGACKTGMLLSGEVIRAVEKFLRKHELPLVVDPVMAASSGARLLRPGAVRALKQLCAMAV